MTSSSSPRGWHSRGYLPHFDGGDVIQFITLGLSDSVPRKVLRKWQKQLALESDSFTRELLLERVERYMDNGYGECFLKIREIANLVGENLMRFDGIRYDLFRWVVMPNHTHFIIRPRPENELSKIIKNHKSYIAHQANKILNRSGQFWQEDYFDRAIRDRWDFIEKLDYVDLNPVRAGLCQIPEDWEFSSARETRKFRI